MLTFKLNYYALYKYIRYTSYYYFAKVRRFILSEHTKSIFTDESLRFLYSSPMFQQLSEEQQMAFLSEFEFDESLQQQLDIALEIQGSVKEVESFMPKMLDKDHAIYVLSQYHKHLKSHIEQRDNILYVPFNKKLKYAAPFIVLLQQSKRMASLEHFTKGMLLPLFNSCARQQRDLIVIPFNENVQAPITFENGQLLVEQFQQFLLGDYNSNAKIVAALEKAIHIFKEDRNERQRELFIVTDNQFMDFEKLQQSEIDLQLKNLQVVVSVVAKSEEQFDMQPITFADKVYFINE